MRYRHLRRTVIAVLAAIAFVLGFALLVHRLLEAPFARQTALNWLEDVAHQFGADLQIESLDWGYLPPRLLMDGVTVTTAEVRAEVDWLTVDLARLRVARRTLELGNVVAKGVHIEMEGLPEKPEPRQQPSQVRIAARRLEIDDLSFEGRQLPGNIDLALNGVGVAWITEDETPRGHLEVEQAVLQAGGLEPVEVAVRAKIEVADGLSIPTLKITGDGLTISGEGRLSASEGAEIAATGTIELEQLDRTIHANDQLSGRIAFSAELDSNNTEIVQLEVRSDHLEAAGFPLSDLRGRLTIGRDWLNGTLEHAVFHQGRLKGTYRLAHLTGPTRPHTVRLQGDGIVLAGLLDDIDVPTADLAATFSADVEMTWNGRSIPGGNAHGVAVFSPLDEGVPVSGEVRCELNSDGLLQFFGDDLQLGASTMDWQGPLTLGTWEPAWSVHASPAALDEVVVLINHWTGSTVLPEWVAGTADIDVTLSGPWNQLAVGVRLDAQPLLLPPITLDRVVAEGDIRGSELELGQTRFTIGDGQGAVEGAMHWGRDSGTEQLDLDIRGHRIPIDRIADWIGVIGQANGALSFTGGLRGPLALPRGSWAVGIDDAVILGQTLGDGSASVDLADARFNARGIDFDLGLNGSIWWEVASGTIGGSLRWAGMPLTLFGDAVIQLAGDAADVDLEFELPRGGYVSGHLEASSPAAHLTARAEPETITIDAKLADAATANATLNRSTTGSLEGEGELRLESAASLVSRTSPDSNIPLSGDGHASFDVWWPQGGLPNITGTVLDLGLDLDGRPVRLLEPAEFAISEEGFEVEGHRLLVADDELHARWMIRPDGGLQGELSGSTDALLLRFLLPEWEPAGRANGEVDISGTVTRPLFEGITELSQASFRIPGTRNILSGINGTLLLSSDEFSLEGVDFRFMQGIGRCGGAVKFSDGVITLGLSGDINDLRYEMFPGLVAFLSGTWRLDGPADSLDLSGDITVDRALLRRKDDVTALLLDWFSETSAVPGTGGMRLDLHVEADQTIDISNPFVRLVGSASIDIGGTTAQPGIVGNIEFEEGGEVTLQTVRYEIERGTLTFSDPSSNQPFIELQARTWIQNYDITVRLTGTTDRLVPSVASNPPLPEDEIYSLLGVGYRDQRLGRGAMGVAFASSMITRELTAELERRTNLILPIDQVRVDPFTESSTGNPTARVSVIKQLHPTWTFMLQSNLSGPGETVVVSRWYLAPGLFIEGSRDIDSSYGVDLKLRRPY